MAKIAIPAKRADLDAPSDVHVPRAAYFLIVDTSSGDFEAISNPGATADSHPGAHAAKALISSGVLGVIGHRMGPHPVRALDKNGVLIYRGDEGVPARDMLARFTSGSLEVMRPEQVLAEHEQGHHHDHRHR